MVRRGYKMMSVVLEAMTMAVPAWGMWMLVQFVKKRRRVLTGRGCNRVTNMPVCWPALTAAQLRMEMTRCYSMVAKVQDQARRHALFYFASPFAFPRRQK
mmetsp:Transcript_25693/g.64759  ORF Transcript_25693/g.64759 Transcript_25693/m.64759 type:complete len:100 (-) Transcript_25693:4201-4500(-)